MTSKRHRSNYNIICDNVTKIILKIGILFIWNFQFRKCVYSIRQKHNKKHNKKIKILEF